MAVEVDNAQEQVTEQADTEVEGQIPGPGTEGEGAAETPAGESTTEGQGTEGTNPAAEAHPAAPAWDPERQRRDEEKARREAERIDRLVDAAVAKRIKAAATPAPDELSQIKSLVEELDGIEAKEEACLADADVVGASAQKKAAREKRRQLEALRLAREARIENERQSRNRRDSESARQQQELAAYLRANPEYDPAKFLAARSAAIQQAEDEGFVGSDAVTIRMRQIMGPQLASLKKSSAPVTPRKQPPQTAAATGNSTPPGTRPAPSGAGVRPAANQIGQTAKTLGDGFRAKFASKK